MEKPLVSIVCTAYNHEKYIRDCIEGFLAQKTTFPFEVLINEDASTDNTASIIRGYEEKFPHIIKPIYQKENQYSKRTGLWRNILFPRAQGKYIAMCEGDDYWTDALKLQKQVDFLEENEEYILTCGGFEAKFRGGKEIIIEKGIVPVNQETQEGFTFTLEDATKGWFTKTLTSLFRNRKDIYVKLGMYKRSRDLHLFYHLLKNGKGYYFKEVFGAYNMHAGGISSLKSDKEKHIMHYFMYKELYGMYKDEFSRIWYLRMCLEIINSKISRLSKNKTLNGFVLLKESVGLVKTKDDLIPFIKAFIPRQIKDLKH